MGATSIIIYFVFCFINGFTGGFGICLGQRFGARDEAGMRKSIAVSTLLSVGFTVILTLICCLGAHRILELMQIPADISGEAYDYMFVVLPGTGATVFYNMISNMLRALGDSRTPLYFLVFSSVLNIFLDFLFILPFHMGVAGAAWATILSQFLSALLSLMVGWKNFEILHLHRGGFPGTAGEHDSSSEDGISHGLSDVSHVHRPAGYADSGKFARNCCSRRVHGGIQGGSVVRSCQ